MSYREMEVKFNGFKKLIARRLGLLHEEKDNSERQQEFNEYDQDTKHKLISPHLDFYTDAIAKRTEVMPVLSTLAATLIIIATLNQTVVPLSTLDVKVLLSIFLVLIPTTLKFYIVQKEKAVNAALGIIESYQGRGIIESVFSSATFWDYFNSSVPNIVVDIFYGAIVFLLIRIWLG